MNIFCLFELTIRKSFSEQYSKQMEMRFCKFFGCSFSPQISLNASAPNKIESRFELVGTYDNKFQNLRFRALTQSVELMADRLSLSCVLSPSQKLSCQTTFDPVHHPHQPVPCPVTTFTWPQLLWEQDRFGGNTKTVVQTFHTIAAQRHFVLGTWAALVPGVILNGGVVDADVLAPDGEIASLRTIATKTGAGGVKNCHHNHLHHENSWDPGGSQRKV